MKQQEILKKIGNILKELNEQYEYLQAGEAHINDLELELFAYVLTPDSNEYLKVQSELLLQILEASSRVGVGFAVPFQEEYNLAVQAEQPDLPFPYMAFERRNGAREPQNSEVRMSK